VINRNTEAGTISFTTEQRLFEDKGVVVITINVKRLLGQIKVLAITIAVLYLGVYQAVNNALSY